MTYVITDRCVGAKDQSCVEVCPVDCIHPTPDEPDFTAAAQLYIDPDVCVDCGACVDACPVDAPELDNLLAPGDEGALALNAGYFLGG